MLDQAVKQLLTESTTARCAPSAEGANIGTVIGFKHVNYLIEKAVIAHFATCGLPIGSLYERFGLGVDLVQLDTRFTRLVTLDDTVTLRVRPKLGEDPGRLDFEVLLTVDRDGDTPKAIPATATTVLRRDGDRRRLPDIAQVPTELAPLVISPVAVAADGPRPLGGIDGEAVLDRLTAGKNAYAWRFRVPYPYVHYFDRVCMSGYLRLLEEAKHRFVSARGISIGTLLADHNWIPAVTESHLGLLADAHLEEEMYLVYHVVEVFRNLLYRAHFDAYVRRDDTLVHTATGAITHGYGVVENGNRARLVEWDDRVAAALRGAR